MKRSFITLWLMLAFMALLGQVRLNASDSSKKVNWFHENPWSIMVTSSVLPYLSVNLNHQQMHEFLISQGMNVDLDFELVSTAAHLRWRRLLLEMRLAKGLEFRRDEDVSISGDPIFLEQDFAEFSFSLGCMVYSNPYISFVPKVGVGQSSYRVQYTRVGRAASFDFDDPRSFSGTSSPSFVHKSGYFHIALDVINGLQNDRGNYVFQGGRIGYQRGWGQQPWESNQATLSSPLSDRSEQLYFSLIFGFAHGLKKKS